MLKIILFLLGLVFLSFLACFSFKRLMYEKVDEVSSISKPISHDSFTDILQQYVDANGNFNYSGLRNNRQAFDDYLHLLSAHHPNDTHWNENQQIAYWINAYNAFTIQLILDHYPVKGIKEIKNGVPFVNSVWDIKFIEIEGAPYDLNNIEHSILRQKFNEPRIHFAINCASVSCPKLRNEAYEATGLDLQLDEAASAFINDTSKNIITEDIARISKIFSWFKGDFTKDDDLIDYLNEYSLIKIKANTKIKYKDYNWNLNDVGF